MPVRRLEEVLFNINQYASVEVPSRRHQQHALLILLSRDIRAIELAKNFGLGNKTVSIYRKKVMYRLGLTFTAIAVPGTETDAHLQRTALHITPLYLTIIARYRLVVGMN